MTIELHQVLFFIFAAIACLSALLVVTLNNPVRSALALVLVFFATAGIWLLAMAEFLALILVLVYVGAVMTLFLFLVMMINVEIESMKRHFFFYAPLGVLVVALLVGFVMMVSPTELLNINQAATSELSNTAQLGMVLYTDYVYAFELAAVLLLVAIIAAIALANRQIVRGKRQEIFKQQTTSKADRLQILKMPSAKKKK